MKYLIELSLFNIYINMNIVLFLFVFNSFFSQEKILPSNISEAAISIVDPNIVYQGGDKQISYPGGDVDPNTGVCTDVVIRSLRKLGLDFQKEIHEDMSQNFNLYPNNWGLSKPDKNIDHRRVYNQMKYFERIGISIPISNNSKDYKPGDIVSWYLGGGLTHIGIVVDKLSFDGKRNLIVHNIGGGQVVEDILFDYKIIGHYRF